VAQRISSATGIVRLPGGKVVKSFGEGLFVQAHGMTVDRDSNVWVTDAQIKEGKGNQVFRIMWLSKDGKVITAWGKRGERQCPRCGSQHGDAQEIHEGEVNGRAQLPLRLLVETCDVVDIQFNAWRILHE